MKKIIAFLLLVSLLTACGPQQQSASAEVEFWGLNAEVVEIDAENSILYVKGLDADSALGERCALDCTTALGTGRVFYVQYDTNGDIRPLELEALLVGDEVAISMTDRELENAKANGSAVALQVQLSTQRLGEVQDAALAAYGALLSGDTTLLNPSAGAAEWWVPDFSDKSMAYEYTYMDLNKDGVSELLVQMVESPEGYNGVFSFENGEVRCWNSDAAEMNCRDYPLVDGMMVRQYDFGGTSNYTLFRYRSGGEEEIVSFFTISEEWLDSKSAQLRSRYTVDGEEVGKEDFDVQFNNLIACKLPERSIWSKN